MYINFHIFREEGDNTSKTTGAILYYNNLKLKKHKENSGLGPIY